MGQPGVVVASDQRRMSQDGRDRPAGLRVFRPEAFEGEPGPVARVVAPENVAAAQALLSRKRDERVAVAAALRAAGTKVPAIAKLLGVTPTTVRDYLACAREWGGLEDVVRDIEYRLIPRAVENVEYWLNKHDKDMTLEVLKGRGVLKPAVAHAASGAPAAAMTVNVQFVNAPAVVETNPLAPVVGSSGEIVGERNR